MPSLVDQERDYFITVLGLSPQVGAALSIADLRQAFYANPPAGGGAAAIMSGTAAQFATVDPTTVPVNSEYEVTNDPTWGHARYIAQGAPQVWVLSSVLNQLAGHEIAAIENNVTVNATTNALVAVGAGLAFSAPGVDYRIHVICPIMSASVLDFRIMGSLYDELSVNVGQWQAYSRSATLGRGPTVSFTSKKISGIVAGTAKTYQMFVFSAAENAAGTVQIANSASSPILMRAITA